MAATPILSIIGKSNTGKTTLVEKLIAALKRRGYRIATIKHHFHSDRSLDTPGKDTWRHAQAGAERVVLVSPLTTVTFDYPSQPPTPRQIAATLMDFDLILTEGFSHAELPAIEVLRSDRNRIPLSDPRYRLALVADFDFPDFEPVFNLNDIDELVDFIEANVIQKNRQRPTQQ